MAEARALILAALLGCRAASPAPDPDRVEIARVVADVEYLRQLPHKAPIVVHLVDHKTFAAAMTHETVADDTTRAFLTAFSLAPADVDLGSANDREAASIAAVYDPKSKRVMVPKDTTIRQDALAHEVAHALVDQHFGIKLNDETPMASIALIEGDAKATEIIYGTRDELAGPGAALWAIARGYGDSERALIAKDAPFDTLADWIPAYRDDLLFRYHHGFRFVAALHRTGGFSLVNRAWSKPPTTAEQILHPEKYLAGEAEIPIVLPSVEGTEVEISTVGEMFIRTVLSMCVDEPRAHAAAAGWGGDRFSIVKRADGRLALLWITAWDDEAAAMRFSTTLEAMAKCWETAVEKDKDAKNARLAPGTKIVRDGARVAIARGMELPAEVFAGVGARPAPSPPLGNVALVPFPEGELKAPSGSLKGRRFTLDGFGLALDVPEDMSAEIASFPGVILKGPSENAYVEVFVIDSRDVEKIQATFAANLSGKGKVAIVDTGRGTVATNLGEGVERRSVMGALTIRTMFVPICGGLRSVGVLGWWGGEINRFYYENVIAALSRVGESPPPACR